MTEYEAFHIFVQICSGLNFMHTNHIIHRNLSSDNILLNKDLTAKITGFEYCMKLPEKNEKCIMLHNTEEFHKMSEYTAPEILMNKLHMEKVDIWSLGIILYEMLHSNFPFLVINEIIIGD